jgi:hypothetical protein
LMSVISLEIIAFSVMSTFKAIMGAFALVPRRGGWEPAEFNFMYRVSHLVTIYQQ